MWAEFGDLHFCFVVPACLAGNCEVLFLGGQFIFFIGWPGLREECMDPAADSPYTADPLWVTSVSAPAEDGGHKLTSLKSRPLDLLQS